MGKRDHGAHSTENVAIIIPAYKEAAVLGGVLDALLHHAAFKPSYTVIVVNDGSPDDTAAVAAARPGVIVLSHIVNMGAGAATRTGLLAARTMGCTYAVAMDADGQHDIGDALRLIDDAKKSGADLLIGSRLKDRQGMPRHKVFGNIVLNLISYMIMGVMVSDSQSGLRVFSRKALEKLTYYSNGYAFCSEMIWHAKKQGLVVAESPIGAIYTDYSKAKGQKNVAGFFAIVGTLIKHRVSGLLNE